MKTRIKWLPAVFIAALLLASIWIAPVVRAAGVTDTEIRIGNIMPYTGPLAAFASIGRAEAAYFDMINERGGINGRKVRFISRDDSSNPKTAKNRAYQPSLAQMGASRLHADACECIFAPRTPRSLAVVRQLARV